jgi:hypothetical protein
VSVYRPLERGDVSVSVLRTGAAFVMKAKVIAIGGDIDVHLTSGLTLGALVDVGVARSFQALQIGPQLKYKWSLGGGRHVPFVRLALIYGQSFDRVMDMRGVGLLAGGGYRWFFTPRVGLGADLGAVAHYSVSPHTMGSTALVAQLGVEVRL